MSDNKHIVVDRVTHNLAKARAALRGLQLKEYVKELVEKDQ